MGKKSKAPERVVETGPVNDRVEVRMSGIHGGGLFALKDLRTDMKLIEYVGEKISKEESERRSIEQQEIAEVTGEGAVYIFELEGDYDLDGNFPNNPARFMNHSCDPNCMVYDEDGKLFIYSNKKIKKGEELTYDYGYGVESYKDHPCRCGSDNCVHYIVGRDYWPQLYRILADEEEKRQREERGEVVEEKPKKSKKKKSKKSSHKNSKKGKKTKSKK